MFLRKTQNVVLILPTSFASALRLMLCASHFVVLHTTLVEQSSSARLQASLQTRSTSIIWSRQHPAGYDDRCCCSSNRISFQIIFCGHILVLTAVFRQARNRFLLLRSQERRLSLKICTLKKQFEPQVICNSALIYTR